MTPPAAPPALPQTPSTIHHLTLQHLAEQTGQRAETIKVEHLTHVYRGQNGIRANDDISFTVRQGEIFGLLGPNGAGKTTLVSQILGLLRPTSGTIYLEGLDVRTDSDRIKRHVGFLPQTGIPMRFVEVERALHYTGRLRGQSERDAKAQAKALIEQLGLGDQADRFVHKLSGGTRRLVNFGMALMGNLQILVLDEPTNELDPQNRRVVWDMLARLNRDRGMTCILVTHNVLEAESVIQRVGVMQKGKLLALGTPGELKAEHEGKAHLEFRFKDSYGLQEANLDALNNIPGSWEMPRPGLYRSSLPLPQVAAVIDAIIKQIGMEHVEDFRLVPPSLEDIYLELANEPEKPANA